MTTPDAFYAGIEATWPPASSTRLGVWTLRDGQGGGKRVSAATAHGPTTPEEIAEAEAGMPHPLFMITDKDGALDDQLAARGYEVLDPTNGYATPITTLTDIPVPRVTAFAVWEPLAIMEEIWAAGGIGPARLAIMHRAKTKTAILARHKDKPAGAAFVAVHGPIAMVHAVEVLEHQRRAGVAQWMMRRAAFWAQDQGADTIAVLCTQANTAANALYQQLGFTRVCGYHYRQAPSTAKP